MCQHHSPSPQFHFLFVSLNFNNYVFFRSGKLAMTDPDYQAAIAADKDGIYKILKVAS